MTIIFDGKAFAKVKEIILKKKVSGLKTKPKLVSILVGNDDASILYTNLKKKAATRIGIKFEIKRLPEETSPQDIIKMIKELSGDKSVHGIMVQLPLPEKIKDTWKKKILQSISPKKDVDGLTKNSPFLPAAVKAVKEIVQFAIKDLPYVGKKSVVVGAKGNVGRGVVKELQKMNFKVTECDKDTRDFYAKLHEADLIVSATGVENLIKGEMLKEGAILIDVGSPKPEIDSSNVRASFVTPVPGGVGPVTIVSLLENLVDSIL